MRGRSDESLMRAYAQGDMKAFEMLYHKHKGPLYRYILRQVSDQATANDLFQGSWEKIVRARKVYRPAAPFAAWMYRIARNHLVDHYRTVKPTAILPEDAPDDVADQVAQDIDSNHRSQALYRAVEALPADQRDAILLKLEGDLSLKEIAAATGVNPETAKSRIRYAVARLKKVLPEAAERDLATGTEFEAPGQA